MSTKGRPTDLELMLYADGELDGERRAAVAAWLRESREAQRKLAGLDLASALVREQAASREPLADGIADDVMKAIADRPGSAGAGVSSIDAERRASVRPARPQGVVVRLPRRVYAAAAVVLAAAAAVALWGRTPSPPEHQRLALLTGAPTAPSAPHVAPSAPEPPSADGDSEHGVVVSAVDFGSRLGAIFYVPTDDTPSTRTTTVVWLADDPAEGDE